MPVFAFDIFCYLIGVFYLFCIFVRYTKLHPLHLHYSLDSCMSILHFLADPLLFPNEIRQKPLPVPMPVTKFLSVYFSCPFADSP